MLLPLNFRRKVSKNKNKTEIIIANVVYITNNKKVDSLATCKYCGKLISKVEVIRSLNDDMLLLTCCELVNHHEFVGIFNLYQANQIYKELM